MGNKIENILEQLEFSAKLIGGSSFLIGTLLFVLQILQSNEKLVLIGAQFVLFAFVVNSFLFLCLIICALIFKNNQKPLLRTAGLLLLNIPIAVVYFMVLVSINSF